MAAVPSWLWLVSALLGIAIGTYLRIKRDGFKLQEFLGIVSIAMMASYLYVWLTKADPVVQKIVFWTWFANSVIAGLVWLKENKASGATSTAKPKTEVARKTGGRAKRGGSRGLW